MHTPALKVAVAGTGGLAQHIAQAALLRGHDVLLLSRNLQEHPEIHQLPVIRVDYALPDSLSTALKGMDTLISTVTNTSAQLALIDACLTARVRRFAPAEFEGLLECRPLACPPSRNRFDVLARLREEKHRLDSTVFVCGLLMERFSPGGLVGSGICSPRGHLKGEGELLLDFRAARAWIPAGETRACFVAARDLAAFVVAALEAREWPEQWRCCGERLTMEELVRIAEEVRGRQFEITETMWEDLNDLHFEKEEKGEWGQACKVDMLLAIERGEFDFAPAEMEVPGCWRPMGLKEWLEEGWRNVDLGDAALESQLEKLDATTLRATLLSIAYPKAAKKLEHCIYCHVTFDANGPDAEMCRVKHFGEPSRGTFTCCGTTYEEEEYGEEEWMEPVEERMPYCFEGPHRTVPWEKGDMRVLDDDEYYYKEDGEVFEDDGRKRWWEELVKDVNFQKLRCGEKIS
ncbi:hypothetical protein BZA05DRAFT_444280 [Tricharina praecox]|uniref:uncharacterized protein n=1 Tax=Tricharina praecox TaxID=43433 RepID=UPI00222024D6|nr:uncharacterized protein BZA05DRAFT_444280 [Tricharina praecox]KAI5854022.1 hypothetical protein BZA05DRAFT_444280 [Tricharina praecox]